MAPDIEEAAMWLDTEATATAGEMPTKISSGVIRNPPPMPNMPDTKPTAAPIARIRKTLTGMSAIGRKSCTRGRFLLWAARGSLRAARSEVIGRASAGRQIRVTRAGDEHGPVAAPL